MSLIVVIVVEFFFYGVKGHAHSPFPVEGLKTEDACQNFRR